MLGDLDLDAVIASGDHVVASDDTAIQSARAASTIHYPDVFPGGIKHNVGLKRTFTLDVWYDFKIFIIVNIALPAVHVLVSGYMTVSLKLRKTNRFDFCGPRGPKFSQFSSYISQHSMPFC